MADTGRFAQRDLNSFAAIRARKNWTMPLKKAQAKHAPSAAPINVSTSASANIDTTTAAAPKPIARSVAISVVRTLTAEYIVLSAPNTAPRPMIPPTAKATRVRKSLSGFDSFAKYKDDAKQHEGRNDRQKREYGS
jgi:hypothetical protein